MVFLVTGGAGFIGVSVIHHLINDLGFTVVNVDKLTYAGNIESLESVSNSPFYSLEQADVCDHKTIKEIFDKYQPDKIMHLAAESHVDRSIDGPSEFIHTNIVGTYTMLDIAKEYWLSLSEKKKKDFCFHYISTDEVYGDLHGTNDLFVESTPYNPSSPYSASKASSDHLVRAWNRTYGLPILITNCSNNYGPFQFPEKLIPLTILNAISGKPISIYGNGQQIRDWLYVEDHAKALVHVVLKGKHGDTYNIGGHNEITNLNVVKTICNMLDGLVPDHPHGIKRYEELIVFVDDRPGHDIRYAIDATKIDRDLNWKPHETFETGIEKTIQWYLDNKSWCKKVQDGSYRGERLGLRGE